MKFKFLIAAAAASGALAATAALPAIAGESKGISASGFKDEDAQPYYPITNSWADYTMYLPGTSYFCPDQSLSQNTYDFYAQLYGIESPFPVAASAWTYGATDMTLEEYVLINQEYCQSQGYDVGHPVTITLNNGQTYEKLSCTQGTFHEDFYFRKIGDYFSFLTFKYDVADSDFIRTLISMIVSY